MSRVRHAGAALGRPDLAILDLDGTLVDTVPDLAFAVARALEAIGRAPCAEDAVRDWVGDGVEALLERALAASGDPRPGARARARGIFEDVYARHGCERSRLYPGVVEGLDFLAGAGAVLACVTNKPQRFTRPILERFALHERFALVVSGDTLERRKPDPAPITYAMRETGVASRRTLVIGDSVNDVRAARAAGAGVVCVTYGYNHGRDVREAAPDAVVDSLARLPDVLGARCQP